MVNRKNTILCTLSVVAFIVLSISLIAKQMNVKRERNAKISQGRENAQRYINEKYGFDAQMLGQSSDKYLITYDNYCHEIEFKMKYNDKVFYVITDTKPDSSYHMDDYQYNEIYDAAESYLTKDIPDSAVIDLILGCPDSCYNFMMNKDIFYDGTNIDDVIKKCRVDVKLIMSDHDTDLSDLDIIDKVNSDNKTLEFTLFDTQEHMNEFLESAGEKVFSYGNESVFQKYAPYITDYYSDDGENAVQRLDITIQKTDNFEYAYFPAEDNTYAKTCNDIKVQNSDFKNAYNNYELNGETSWLSNPITGEYSFDGPYGDVWIYYPLEDLKDYDIKNIGLAWFSFGGMSNCRDISRAEICGDYAVFHIPFGEDSFLFVDNSGQDEYIAGWKKDD